MLSALSPPYSNSLWARPAELRPTPLHTVYTRATYSPAKDRCRSTVKYRKGAVGYSPAMILICVISIPNTNQNTITGRAEYLHVATRLFTYGLYGVGIRQDGAIECSSGGGGLDIQYRPSRQVEVYASGGPVSGTGTCAHSLQILSSASLSVRPSQQTAFYFTANHRPNNGILPQTQWISSFTGGVDHAFNQRIEVTSDYAYSYGAASSGNPSLQESYVGASLKIVFAGSVWQTMSILHYANSGFSANPNRTIALFTLWWTPSILGNNSRHGGSI